MSNKKFITEYCKKAKSAIAYLLISGLQWVVGNAYSAPILGNNPENSLPVHSSQGAVPMVLLTVARDHSLFFPAYNDMTDLNGDGKIDIKFNPGFAYLGLFNPVYCYKYNGVDSGSGEFFFPAGYANALTGVPNPGGCQPNSGFWSGNWLNYVTTSRMDAMRVALYGGLREVDGDDKAAEPRTILRRAYIPQDGHAWAKEYSNADQGTYDIKYYAPFTAPGLDKGTSLYHLFGNLTSTVTRNLKHTLLDTNIKKADGTWGWVKNWAPNPWTDGTPTQSVDDAGVECSILNDCSNYTPLLRVVKGAGNPARRWASSQRPVLDVRATPIVYVGPFLTIVHPTAKGNSVGYGNLGDTTDVFTTVAPVLKDYVVRVKACFVPYTAGCAAYSYTNAGGTKVITYKPTGVLQDYGDNGSINFGLLTGSYDDNLSGGRIRKDIRSFANEVDLRTGVFSRPSYSIITHLDKMRISNFNVATYPNTSPNPNHDQLTVPNYDHYYFANNFIYKDTWTYGSGDPLTSDGVLPNGKVNDWGNPLAEMMYEGLRYYAGGPPVDTGYDYTGRPSKILTREFNTAVAEDTRVFGIAPLTSWGDPYQDTTKWCAKPNIMVVSGPHPSWDSDQLPGSTFPIQSSPPSLFAGNLRNAAGVLLDVSEWTKRIGDAESINSSSRFIGENWNVAGWPNTDRSPTLKDNVSLEKIRGLVPDQTDNQGSFLSAGLAYWAKQDALRKVGGHKIPTVDTYAMLLNSPFPSIKIPFYDVNGNVSNTVTIMPFAKTQTSLGATTLAQQTGGMYFPTNQLVGVYPTLLTDPLNTSGSFHMMFDANFEDHAWGGDFEMDVVVIYEIQVISGKVVVSMTRTSQNGSAVQNIGYIITGTSATDGPYIDMQSTIPQDASGNSIAYPFYLNTPNGGATWYGPGWCAAAANFTKNICGILSATSSTRSFTPASNYNENNDLKNPLWYAARWGGYPDGSPPVDSLPPGVDPDHYIQVYSPANLKVAFQNMIQSVLDNGATVGTVASSSQQLQTSSQLFTTSFNTSNRMGELSATSFTVTPGAASDTITYSNFMTASPGVAATKYYQRPIYFQAKDASTRSYRPLIFNDANFWTSPAAGWSSYFDSKDVFHYLQGDQSKEIKNKGIYRNRITLLGPAVNSMPTYSQETGDVYVGMNDGMLHAFSATDLSETFSYVPALLITTTTAGGKSVLNALSNPTTPWRYTVDGNIAVSSISQQDSGMNASSNYLIAFLGRGGRGLFSLEIDRATHTPIKSWEYPQSPGDNDLGYLLGQPLIEQLADGTTVAIFGNGYDSVNKKAVLYVVRLRDGAIIQKFVTTGDAFTPNGLGTPGIVRKNGFATYAYAGDYAGNVWKFTLPTGFTSLVTTYTTNTADITKLFTTAAHQPIVAPITTAFSYDATDLDVKDKQFVFFGTGSDLTVATTDFTSTATQTMYGLIDDMSIPGGTVAQISAGALMQRSLDLAVQQFAGYTAANLTLNVRTMSLADTGDMHNKHGWYMDWFSSAGGAPSEKVFTAAALRPTAVPTLVVSSSIANSGTCVSTGAGYLNAMDAYHGGSLPLTDTYFDINRNGSGDELETVSGKQRAISSIDFGIGAIGQAGFTGNNVIVQGSGPNPAKATDNIADVGTRKLLPFSRRTSWREITN